ncbi:MAG: hypothetical protein HQL13_05380 [Candidatus Omnitrophica bacterium]|nr:hypothetical protein [Candidatus Omnitrophota bacterium]
MSSLVFKALFKGESGLPIDYSCIYAPGLKPSATPGSAAMANISSVAPTGGIDLSQQDKAMRVEKDANGGVKVYVDPALIAAVERAGVLHEVDPVIVGWKPVDIRVVLGV